MIDKFRGFLCAVGVHQHQYVGSDGKDRIYRCDCGHRRVERYSLQIDRMGLSRKGTGISCPVPHHRPAPHPSTRPAPTPTPIDVPNALNTLNAPNALPKTDDKSVLARLRTRYFSHVADI